MAQPELPIDVAAEGQSVDEDRPHTIELNVVRGRVRKRHVTLERREVQVELQQRCCLQCAERPLVRMRNEIELRMLQQVRSIAHGLAEQLQRQVGLRNEHAALDQRWDQPARFDVVEILSC